jgi:DNA replication ATP-dependent helicase Dna2
MPRLSKQTISSYLRSECFRRLRLDLSPDTNQYRQERTVAGMPPRQVQRPGLEALAAAGDEWERAKLSDLEQTFGAASVVGNRQAIAGGHRFDAVPLANVLSTARPGQFIAQGQYDVGPAFQSAVGLTTLISSCQLALAEVRPDIIQVWPAGQCDRAVQPDGNVIDLPTGDPRSVLRIIDIKLTSEPSVPYFVETTYYAMALAGWLMDNGLDRQFVVAPSATIWPGSHDASTLVRLLSEHQAQGTTPSRAELDAALNEDLESGEFRVFAPRLRRFFESELPRALATPWRQLPWHVDNRCIGCEYLGYPWPGTSTCPDHCWSQATTQDHLSRVAFVSRGARGALEDGHVGTVSALAGTNPTDAVYDTHHTLRASRTVVAGRAQALNSGTATLPPQAGTSAVMPAWADLRIYLTADFDIGSGITVGFGFQAVWTVNRSLVPPGQHYQRFGPQAFPVDQRSLQVEERELSHLLDAIDQAMRWAQGVKQDATVQIYIWDTLTYQHITRVIGRHLANFMQNRSLRRLAWLFPPDTLVANPDLSDRMCPVTVVREVIRGAVAAPVPHYYSLLNVAREYHSSHTQAPYNQFQVPGLFEDPLSDQVPSERAHEIWSRAGAPRPWNQQLNQLERTIRVKLSAVENVAQRLGEDLRGHLDRTAPRIQNLRPPSLPRRMADDARLWFVFARLNVALEKLDVQQVHAMPPHEREARFKSARLVRRLAPTAAQPVLAQFGLNSAANRSVYELGPGSTEVRAKEGDFTFALAPAARPGFLGEALRRIAGQRQLPLAQNQSEWMRMEYVTRSTVVAIDRDQRHIVLDLDSRWLPVVQALENANLVNLTADVMLDPVHRDYLLDRIEATLNAIGNPPVAIAQAIPSVANAIGRTRRATRGTPSPAADIFWNAAALSQVAVNRQLQPVRYLLQRNGHDLNPSQWQAWEQALSHRLRLIWGPPGTGKSRTLRTLILGALLEASQGNRSIRVLLSGPTYESIDNVLLDVYAALSGGSPLAVPGTQVVRLRSGTRPRDARIPHQIDLPTGNGGAFQTLCGRLGQAQGLTLVGATAQQAHRLLDSVGGAAARLFDLIVLDEASQLDVATSALPLAGLADGGSVVIAGDPKQLPPIHKAEPPLDLEFAVGPIFTYLRDRFNLTPCVLEVNYRSSRTIVEFAHTADYPRSLQAHSPDLGLDLLSPIPQSAAPPPNWPTQLYWTPEWAAFLDPDEPVVCFVYPEGRSSQWNQFEADAVASILWLVSSRLGDQLQNELDANGAVIPMNGRPYAVADFWNRGVGIVTPHRAQQALTVSRLQNVFPVVTPSSIRTAVDTVERFQGQQRDVVLATFALGDPDAIADEDEFLLSLNRFNVMASRARAKLIVLVSQEVVDHLSSDMSVLQGSALLKGYADLFCSQSRPMSLGYLDTTGAPTVVNGAFRWHA